MCKRINVFFPIYIASYMILSLLYALFVHKSGIHMAYWQQCLISEVVLLLPVFIYIFVNRINVMKCLPIRKLRPLDALLSLLLGYALIPAVLTINYVTMLFSTNYMEATQNELMQYPYLLQVVLLAVLPPLVEEFIFRGIFYHSYRRNGVVGAAVISGLIFGCVHMNINQFCYAFLIGIVFALLVEATGSIWSSVIAHFAINTFSITVSKLASLSMGSDYLQKAQEMEGGITAATVGIQIIGLLWFSVCGLAVAYVIYRAIAKRNGRWEYMKNNFRMGMKAQNGEKFFSPVSIATFAAIGAFMIFTEIMNRL